MPSNGNPSRSGRLETWRQRRKRTSFNMWASAAVISEDGCSRGTGGSFVLLCLRLSQFTLMRILFGCWSSYDTAVTLEEAVTECNKNPLYFIICHVSVLIRLSKVTLFDHKLWVLTERGWHEGGWCPGAHALSHFPCWCQVKSSRDSQLSEYRRSPLVELHLPSRYSDSLPRGEELRGDIGV